MRAFLALELDEKTRQALAGLQEGLENLEVDASYPRTEQLHVTLCFFGEISENDARQKIEKLRTFSFSPFDAAVSGIGFFPSPSHVRVVWAGFTKGKEELTRLQEELSDLLAHVEGQPFEPHVTLARIRTQRNREQLLDFVKHHADFSAPFAARRLVLMQSVLSHSGPKYRVLKKIDLAASVTSSSSDPENF